MLAVQVVIGGEVAEGLNREKQTRFGVERQFVDARRHEHLATDEGATEVVVEHPDAASG